MFTPPTPPLAFAPTAKGGIGIGGRSTGEPRETSEPVPAPEPERTEQPPAKDED
ncbi:hypothetical protein ACFWTE_11640 [Nocardiopsis sp. NPDC058631]|uniref:hypothetical protein n=1 Tax=Nocardiopsis sp. NPDC058631 TaxID=3346566 RepID=UPI00366A304B